MEDVNAQTEAEIGAAPPRTVAPAGPAALVLLYRLWPYLFATAAVVLLRWVTLTNDIASGDEASYLGEAARLNSLEAFVYGYFYRVETKSPVSLIPHLFVMAFGGDQKFLWLHVIGMLALLPSCYLMIYFARRYFGSAVVGLLAALDWLVFSVVGTGIDGPDAIRMQRPLLAVELEYFETPFILASFVLLAIGVSRATTRPVRARWLLFGSGVAYAIAMLIKPTALLIGPLYLAALLLFLWRDSPRANRVKGVALAAGAFIGGIIVPVLLEFVPYLFNQPAMNELIFNLFDVSASYSDGTSLFDRMATIALGVPPSLPYFALFVPALALLAQGLKDADPRSILFPGALIAGLLALLPWFGADPAPFVVIALYAFTLAVTAALHGLKGWPVLAALFVAGTAWGAAVILEPLLALLAVPFIAALVVLYRRRRGAFEEERYNLDAIIRSVTAFGIGAAIAFFALASGPSGSLFHFLLTIPLTAFYSALLLPLFLIAHSRGWISWRQGRWPTLLILSSVAVFISSAPGRAAPQYLTPIVALLILGVAGYLALAVQRLAQNSSSRLALAAGVGLVLIFAGRQAPELRLIGTQPPLSVYMTDARNRYDVAGLTDYIEQTTHPGAKIWVCCRASELYIFADRAPATRDPAVAYMTDFWSDPWFDRTTNELAQDQPDLVIDLLTPRPGTRPDTPMLQMPKVGAYIQSNYKCDPDKVRGAVVCLRNGADLPASAATVRGTWGSCQAMAWQQPIKLQINGSSLQKNDPSKKLDASAIALLKVNGGDASIKTNVESKADTLWFGFSTGQPITDITKIDYSFYVVPNSNAVAVKEKDIKGTKTGITNYVVPAQLEIGVNAGVVNYYYNGKRVYTSAAPATYPLYIAAGIGNPGGRLLNAVMCGDQIGP